MKILYIGNYRHPFCTEVHLTEELEKLGHVLWREQEPPGGGDLAWLKRLEETCEIWDPEAVFFQRTWGVPPETTQLWRELEASGIKTASYHLDLYWGLEREKGLLEGDPFWTTGTVFTPDGDPESARRFADAGINHVWVPPAVVTSGCYRGKPRNSFKHDVVFVGSYNYHPEWPWRQQLIDGLAAHFGPRFKRWGGDVPGGPIRERKLNDLYASAKVVVGDSLCLPGHVNYWSDRPYETVGRGGFLLMPAVPGLEQHFQDGEHLWFYDPGDLSNVIHQVETALASPEKREACAAAGQAHVRENHTYQHRLAYALEHLG